MNAFSFFDNLKSFFVLTEMVRISSIMLNKNYKAIYAL